MSCEMHGKSTMMLDGSGEVACAVWRWPMRTYVGDAAPPRAKIEIGNTNRVHSDTGRLPDPLSSYLRLRLALPLTLRFIHWHISDLEPTDMHLCRPLPLGSLLLSRLEETSLGDLHGLRDECTSRRASIKF